MGRRRGPARRAGTAAAGTQEIQGHGRRSARVHGQCRRSGLPRAGSAGGSAPVPAQGGAGRIAGRHDAHKAA